MVANLLTTGNVICGFIAVVLIGSSTIEPSTVPINFKIAAWLIMLGMVFDALDGKIARSTGTTSPFGAQLDTLADLVTFGLAPSVLVFHMRDLLPFWKNHHWILWCFCVAYFLGAVLRLARFTVENKPDKSAHLCFKGLPTPGAAGVIASSVILYCYIQEFKQPEIIWFSAWKESLQNASNIIPLILPFCAGFLGYTMVSNRLFYVHVASRFLSRRTFDAFAYVVFGIILILLIPEIMLPLLFFVYLFSSPWLFVVRKIPFRKIQSIAGSKQRSTDS